ncbi:hypothetical protein BU23DRAFT_100982 [Bimuria novae-zelandiae CBS 107.79]|uniref:Uncharacterized protein n=1 Tax=Bimuria novae-zelandiae CBS 107.79 TaxID=1447943 RepID=A0A6A5VQR5_9PLEO|nr:hypothetical protein BU23DRAFT_100982 [Bimuria novae-zelandiae CBS 107.79]
MVTSIASTSLRSSSVIYSTGSSAIISGRVLNNKPTAHSTSVRRNVSTDNSIQVNGHIAGKINYIYCDTVVFRCDCTLSSKAVPHVSKPSQCSINTPVSCGKRYQRQQSVLSNIVTNKELASLIRQNIRLVSDANGQPHTVCVISPRDVVDSFIAKEIMHRLQLKAFQNSSLVYSIKWGITRLYSTGEFVDLSCYLPGSTRSVSRRCYIVEHCPFDLLLGSNEIESD